MLSFLYSPTLTSIHDYWKNHSFNYRDLCWQNNVSDFNMLSRLVIAFLPRSKCLLISWLQSASAEVLEPKIIKSVTVSIVSPFISHEVMGPDAMILVFWMLSFKPTFPLSSYTFIKRLFSFSSLSAIRVVSSAYLRLLIGWFQTGKEVHQGCILSPCLFNFYAEYIIRNAGLEEHKLESRLPGEISITSDMQMTPPLWQKVKRN